MPKYTTDEDLELLAELGVDIAPEPSGQRSAREERMIALRRSSGLWRNMADCLSMGRIAIFSSGSMRCGSIACENQRNVAQSYSR